MSLHFFHSLSFFRRLIFKLWLWDAQQKLGRIQAFFQPDDQILEIGSGLGTVCMALQQKGFAPVALDIIDASMTPTVEPIIYDGQTLPFENEAFDIVLLLTVLHHTPNPEKIIVEARRVGKKIIIIEDIFKNTFQKYLTFFADSLMNMEFVSHPHTNKTDTAWRQVLAQQKLVVKEATYSNLFFFFRQVTYVLEKA